MKSKLVISAIGILMIAATFDDGTMAAVPGKSTWRGKRGEVVITAKVREHSEGKIILVIEEPHASKEEWTFDVSGTSLSLSGVRTLTKGGPSRKDVKGSGVVDGGKIKVSYSWKKFAKNVKDLPVEGDLTLEPDPH